MKNFYVEFDTTNRKNPATCSGNSMTGEVRIKDGDASTKVVDITCAEFGDELVITVSPNYPDPADKSGVAIINKTDGRIAKNAILDTVIVKHIHKQKVKK